MSSVRVLVGTRKGAFILTSDGKRQRWEVSGPHFAGWEIYHLKGSPVDPDRIYASQTSGWFGQIIQRSDDGGKTWHQPGTPAGEPTTTPDGMPHRREQQVRLRHVARDRQAAHDASCGTTARSTRGNSSASGTWSRRSPIPNTVYAGVEDAAMFRTTDGGKSWHELAGLRGHGTGPQWQPGAGGMGLHTILIDPKTTSASTSPFRRPAHFAPTTAAQRGSRSTAACGRSTSRSRCRSRPLRPSHRATSVAAGRAVHAEALGRDAERRRRRKLARSERRLADRLRLSDRRSRPRARDDLCRADHQRLAALPAGRQTPRVSQPHRAATTGSRSPMACHKRIAT